MRLPREKKEHNNLLPDLEATEFKLARFIPLLVLAFGFAITWLSWDASQQLTAKELQDYFDFRVGQTLVLTEQRMLAQVQVLRGAQGLFAASQKVDRNEFRSYVASQRLDENYPGIQGIGFSLIVLPQNKLNHIAVIRKESGHPEYFISPEGERDIYTSIIYLEPFYGRNLRAFGYDMYAEPVRRAAMELARDSGRASLSGNVRLVQENNKNVQSGFLIYLPVYRNGAPVGTVQERRNNIVGWVYSPFRMNDLARGMYGERSADLDIEIYDGETTSPDALMYESFIDKQRDMGTHLLSSIKHLKVADHTWTLKIHSLPALETQIDRNKPTLIAIAGAGASFLFGALTLLLIGGRSRALAYAREVNQNLIDSERAVRTSEERLQLAIRAGHIGTWDYDPMHNALFWNDSMFNLYGTKREHFSGAYEAWQALVHPDDRSRCDKESQEALQGIKELDTEFRILHPNGNIRYIKAIADVIRDENGKPIRMIGVNWDITERKKSEEALQESEYRWKFALEGAGDGVWDWDISAGQITFSKRWYEIQGFEEGTIGPAVDGWKKLVHPDDLTVAELALQAHFRGETHSFSCEHRVRCKNGQYKWILGRGMVVKRDVDGTPLRAIGTHTDISERKQNEIALISALEKSKHLSDALDNVDTYVYMKDLQLRYIYANEITLKLLNCSADKLEECDDTRFFSPQTASHIRQIDSRVLTLGEHSREEIVVADSNGKLTTYLEIKTPIYDSAGVIIGLCGISHNITERKQIEEMTARSEANLRAILDSIPYMVWLKDMSCCFVAVNQAFLRAAGKSRMDEVVGRTDFDLWPRQLAQKYRDDDLEVMDKIMQKLTEEQFTDNGAVTWMESFKAPVLTQDGKLLGTTGFMRDITDRKRAHELLQHMAHFDTLTGLPNRKLLSDRLQHACAMALRQKMRLALMFIDLDKFKPVNDELGHHVGDQLLKEVAQRIKDCVRDSDTVARIGGDEFLVLLPMIETELDALLVAEKIRESLHRPFVLVEQSLRISSSTGIAIYPEHGKDEAQLMKNADIAMYRAKEIGRNNVVLYRPEML